MQVPGGASNGSWSDFVSLERCDEEAWWVQIYLDSGGLFDPHGGLIGVIGPLNRCHQLGFTLCMQVIWRLNGMALLDSDDLC